MSWAIYYGDGSRFTDEDGDPADAPGYDVQAIGQSDEEVGRHIVHRRDFYIRRDGEWYGVDLPGLLDHLTDIGIVKQGRTRSNRDHGRAYAMATSDPYLPRKSALRADEEPPPREGSR